MALCSFNTDFWCDFESHSSFIDVLQSGNIDYKSTQLHQKGVVENPTYVVQIIEAISTLGIAGVIIAWLKIKASRKVQIMKSDLKTVIITQGYSVKEIEKIVKNARHISLKDK